MEKNRQKRQNGRHRCADKEWLDVEDGKLVDDETLQAEVLTQAADQRRELNTNPDPCPELRTITYDLTPDQLEISLTFVAIISLS